MLDLYESTTFRGAVVFLRNWESFSFSGYFDLEFSEMWGFDRGIWASGAFFCGIVQSVSAPCESCAGRLIFVRGV